MAEICWIRVMRGDPPREAWVNAKHIIITGDMECITLPSGRTALALSEHIQQKPLT